MVPFYATCLALVLVCLLLLHVIARPLVRYCLVGAGVGVCVLVVLVVSGVLGVSA